MSLLNVLWPNLDIITISCMCVVRVGSFYSSLKRTIIVILIVDSVDR